MTKMNDDVIDLQVDDLLAAQKIAPSLDRFSVALMTEWGGPGGLARSMRECYDESNSPNTRSQILRLVVDVLKLSTNKDDSKDDKALQDPKMLAAAMRKLANGS